MHLPHSLNPLKTPIFLSPGNTASSHLIRVFGATVLGAALFVSCTPSVQADGQVQPPAVVRAAPPQSTPSLDAHKALQLVQTRNACSLPLDLKVESATVEELAPLVQRKLAASSDPFIKRLRVEVRNVRLIRLSFDAKGSTVGGVLNSAAFLSGAKLWSFADYLLIAPAEALTDEERESNQTGIFTGTDRLSPEVVKAFTGFLRDEIKGLPDNATAKPLFSSEMLFNKESLGGAALSQLSPDAQSMLHALVQSSNDTSFTEDMNRFARMKLIPDAFVSINPGNKMPDSDSLSVEVPSTSIPAIFQFTWSFNGSGGGATAGGGAPPPRTKAPQPTPPSPDPSAEKS